MSRDTVRPGPERPTTPSDGTSRGLAAFSAADHGRWPAIFLALLTAAVATIALVSHQLAVTRTNNAVPDGGFYWAVAQYQIAHQRLKQELRAIAAGEPADAQELTRHSTVFASKASILTEPSEVKTLLDGVAGYADAAHQLADLHRRIGPVLEKKGFAQTDAVIVLGEFKAMGDDELLSRLASNVRLAEVIAKEEMLHSLSRRSAWVWAGFGMCWTALALWLLYAVRSRRLFARAAVDRQRAVEAMEQAIRAKRAFLSMVSHELRSPLQSIVVSVDSLALDLSVWGNRPHSVAAIRRIRHAVSLLQGQFRDLLTIARSDTGQLSIQVETFEFGELVRDVCADLEDSAAAKGLALRVEVRQSPVTVVADPIRIAQVLRNLVENAVRYTASGHIEVCLRAFEAGAASAQGRSVAQPAALDTQATESSSPGWVRFTVSDTGPGLPAQAVQRLRADRMPFESSIDGTGIGLYVIRDVLNQLGGTLDVQSRADEGTTFTVGIPVTLATDATDATHLARVAGTNKALGAPDAKALNILIVDDRADVLAALAELTRQLGHSCDPVASAEDAHVLLASTHYDTVLIDLEMPGKDGLVLASEIRLGAGPNSTSMLILISAAGNCAAGSTWPFDGFLEKPIDSLALSKLIGSRSSR